MAAHPSFSAGRHRPRGPRSSLAVVLAVALALIALAWTFVDAGGLRPAERTERSCEQLWQDGRHTSELADVDHDDFVATCTSDPG